MRLFKNTMLCCLLSVSTWALSNPGVFEINSACLDVGCFSGDDPATRTVEINKLSGTFRLASDLNVNQGGIIVSEQFGRPQVITIDLNGFEIRYQGGGSTTNGIKVTGNNSFVTIKNGSISSYKDGIQADLGASVHVDNMVFRIIQDDAIQAASGRITDSVFDCVTFGINAVGPSGATEGDVLLIENNIFRCGVSSTDRPVFSVGATNICKDNYIMYDAGSNNNFGACLLVGTNVCDSQVCSQGRSVDFMDDSKE